MDKAKKENEAIEALQSLSKKMQEEINEEAGESDDDD